MATGFTPISSSASATTIWASPRAPPPPKRERHGFHLAPASRAKRQAVSASGRTICALAGGVLAGRGAVAHAAGDALQDRGDAEEIVGEIGRQMRPRIEPGARAIHLDVGRQRRNAERREIEADQRAGAGAGVLRRHVPLHQVVGEVGERIADGGQLPVEHRQHAAARSRAGSCCRAGSRRAPAAAARPAGCAPAAIRSAAPSRRSSASPRRGTASTSGRPGARRSSRRGRSRRGRWPAGSNECSRASVVHRVIDRRALGRVGARHLRIPEHPARDEAHHVERRAGDALVGAIDAPARRPESPARAAR